MKIIFLTYINRSGSTFLSNQLGKHQNILACPEAEILANELLLHSQKSISHTNNSLIDLLLKDNKLKTWNLPKDIYSFPVTVKTYFDAFEYLLIRFRDKYKPNSEYVLYKAERLFQLYPIISKRNEKRNNIYFVYLVRDIRAVYFSQKHTLIPETNKFFTNSPIETSLYWNNFINSIPGTKEGITTVKYENLILDFNNEVKRILTSLSLTGNIKENTSSLSRFIPDNYKQIHKNIDKKPQVSRVEAWKNKLKKEDLVFIELASAKYLIRFNYELINKYQKHPYINLNFLKQILKVLIKNLFMKITYKIRINKDIV